MAARKISKAEAERLWGRLRQLLIDLAAAFEEIIEKEAWKPIGYDSFAKAYADRMADVTLASEIRPHVVFQMYREGYDEEFVVANVKEVGPIIAESLKHQFDHGVPPGSARMARKHYALDDATLVREHLRDRPSKPGTIHIAVGPTLLREYQRIAKKNHCSVEDLALEFIKNGFRGLV